MFSKEMLPAFLCLFMLAFSYVIGVDATFSVIEDKAKLPILTPAFSERQTMKIRLENGLEALLISDPKADKSAVTLSVRAGSWEDPEEYPGIAHFLEHMLFMGTKKYPNESEYSRYITENGGATNAFTASHFTSYMFSINNNAFDEALDRFADFFKTPLFNPSGVDRELQAIDQEYAKNLENDTIREIFVWKELANPQHPHHHFNMGNSSTLKAVSQETLKEWYRQHYSANLMKLIVYSVLPLDKIRDLVVADFSGIPDTQKQPFHTETQATAAEYKEKMIYVDPIKDIRTLTLFWELPGKFDNMKDERPYTVLAYILGHEGQGSLLAELKQEQLAESLRAGGHMLGSNNLIFAIEIGLTDRGLEEINKVILRIYQAIGNLQKKEIPPYLFEEIQKMGTIHYQYQARENAFSQIMREAGIVIDEDMATYPEQTLILQKSDAKAVKDMLSYMTARNAFYSLMAPFSKLGLKEKFTEKWLNVPYAIRDISQEQIRQWEKAEANPAIDLPEANKLIPKKLNLVSKEAKAKDERLIPVPSTVMNTESALVYCWQDTQYKVPEIWWQYQLKSPEIDPSDATKSVLADLYTKSLREALNKFSYDAQMAGLEYSIEHKDENIGINVSGYSENAHVLFEEIAKRLKNVPSEDDFNIYKDAILRKYFNVDRDSPLKQARELFRHVLYKFYPLPTEKFEALRNVTYAQFQDYIQQLFEETYLEGMLIGNMEEKDAVLVTQRLQLAMGNPKPYPKDQQIREKVIVLPEDHGPYYYQQKINAQGNAVIMAVQFTPFSFKTRAVQQILSQAMHEPFFTELRTKQQTGYIVYNSAEEVEKEIYSLFAVQSNTHNSRDLLARFDLFIEEFIQEMTREDLTAERYEVIRSALLTTLKQPENNLDGLGAILNTLAFKYEGDFDWINKRIEAFETLSYPEFIEEAQHYMGRQNRQRFAILVEGLSPQGSVFQFSRKKSLDDIRDVSTYSE